LLLFVKITGVISSFLGFSIISSFFIVPLFLLIVSILEALELTYLFDGIFFFIKSFSSKIREILNLEQQAPVKENPIDNKNGGTKTFSLNLEQKNIATNQPFDVAQY